MATGTRFATQGLRTQREELMKQYLVYDGNGRVVTIYSCGYRTPDQGACTRVDYEYASPTSTNVIKMRETNDVWSSSYDI